MICEDGTELSYTNDGQWGDWSGLISCPDNYVICGFRGQYDYPATGDKSGLNNIDFLCCPYIIRVRF